MSILIKGLDMPQRCRDCPFIEWIDDCPITERDNLMVRHTDCPLIEIPPHGRLIDADALMIEHAKAEKLLVALTNTELYNTLLVGGNRFIQRFVCAPTIIEAEVDK